MTSDVLNKKNCLPCGDVALRVLSDQEIALFLQKLPGWQIGKQATVRKIKKTFVFQHYAEAVLFCNIVAGIAQKENHHPELLLTYHHCTVVYYTHALNNLSVNDFICATKIEALKNV